MDKQTETICEFCGCEVDADCLIEQDDDKMCEDCYSDRYYACGGCGEVTASEDIKEQDDKFYCETCFDNKFTKCHNCGDIIRNNDAHCSDITDENYCEECYFELFSTCEDCNCQIFSEDAHYTENSGPYCENCYTSHNNNLHEYEYKPSPIYYRAKNEPENNDNRKNLYFGVELEIESCDNDIDDAVDDLPDFVYAKADSSLDNGLEVVSHPTTYKWLKENVKQWQDILDLRLSGFRSYNTTTCGIHIHLSKNYFSTAHLYKFLKLFYDNPDFILNISQRSQENLSEWATLDQANDCQVYSQGGISQSVNKIAYKAKNKQGNWNRHAAVNLQSKHTIEVRIFRGTLNPRSFWKNIEFLQALVEFTLTASIKSVTVGGFLSYVNKNAKKYINLSNWLKGKNVSCNTENC